MIGISKQDQHQTNPYLLSKAQLKNWQQMTPKKSGQVQMQLPILGGRIVQDYALKPQETLT
jgi:hypothetical protein